MSTHGQELVYRALGNERDKSQFARTKVEEARDPAHALLSLVRKGAIILARLWPEHLFRAQELMLKFEGMDAADASLVTLSELYPNAQLATTDFRDFRAYRRFRLLPLLMPV
jgi:predicted nucleic acid-binding protein